MSSDLKMAPNDKRDSRFHDNHKNSPDIWGKSPPRHGSDATTETNRNDPRSIRCRVFIGNLPVEMKSKELEDTFSKYGRVTGVSVHNNYGFVQFEDDKSADAAVEKENGLVYYGKHIDVNLAGERRKPNMDDRPRDRDSRPPFPFRREREFDRDGRPFRKSPPRERPRFEDYDRFPSRFEPPFDRRGRSPSPPPHRRMDDRPGYGRHDDYYMRDRYRDEPPHHREPYPRNFEHRGEPFDRDRRDPYDSPRGPYPERRDNHYDRYDSYNRDYSRPDDYPGAAKRPRMDYNDRPDDMYSGSKNIEAPTDCVIVVMNKQQRGYAEMVERRLKSVGLVVELHFHGTQPISELLDDVARRGVLYAIVITSQHEIHRSVTVNILHGTPQEHRNMPLDDAMRLVGQNFDQYMQDLRERAKSSSTQDLGKSKTTAPKQEEKGDVSSLLSKAATGADLSADQLTKLIDSLSKRQQELMGSSTTTANGKGGVTASQPNQPAVDPQSIAKQQADLQAKILSILNPGGGGGGGATTGSALSTSSFASQKTVLPGQTAGAVSAPSVQTAGKPATLSTSVKPIFPLYPAQQKAVASSASTTVSTARAPLGTTAAKPLSSSAANQVGKSYPSASPHGSTSASSSFGTATPTAYQFTKPLAQSTYTVGSSKATGTAAVSPAVYGSQATAAQGYTAGTQGVQRIGQPRQTSATSASVPVTSKFSPAGQAIATIGAQRPGVTSAQRMAAPTSGSRPVSGVSGQMRAPSPAGRGLLGAAPGTPRVTTPSAAVRTPSPSNVRMVAPRGPSPVGRGAARTASPASIQVSSRGGAISVRGGAIAVRGGVSGAGRGGATSQTRLAQGAAPVTAASVSRGGIAARGGPVARGAPVTRGVTVTRGVAVTRGAPAQRGATAPRGGPVQRGGPVPRGALVSRGTPVSRGAPAARGVPASRGASAPRGTPYMPSARGGRGGPSTRVAPIRTVTPGGLANRGAPRGSPMMRGAPPFRGGRGNYGGRGGY